MTDYACEICGKTKLSKLLKEYSPTTGLERGILCYQCLRKLNKERKPEQSQSQKIKQYLEFHGG